MALSSVSNRFFRYNHCDFQIPTLGSQDKRAFDRAGAFNKKPLDRDGVYKKKSAFNRLRQDSFSKRAFYRVGAYKKGRPADWSFFG